MIDQDKMRALATHLRAHDERHHLTQNTTDHRAAADAIDLLLAEVEAAVADKRDAERYRLVRAYYTRVVFMQEDGPEIDLWAVGEIGDAYEMQVLDQAVDAALTQRQGEGS